MKDALTAEGVVVGSVPINGVGRSAIGAVDAADIAEDVDPVMVDPVVGFFACDEDPLEAEITVELAAGGICFVDNFTALVIPIELVCRKRRAGSFFDALAIAVIDVGLAASRDKMIFRVKHVRRSGWRRGCKVTRSVIRIPRRGDLVFSADGAGKVEAAFLRAAGVVGGRDGSDLHKERPRPKIDVSGTRLRPPGSNS